MKSKAAVDILAALAQETRLNIFRLLVVTGPAGATPGAIGEQLGIPAATLSFHLKELSRAGLVTARQESRYIYYSANYPTMDELLGFLTENCCEGSACALSPMARPVAVAPALSKRKKVAR